VRYTVRPVRRGYVVLDTKTDAVVVLNGRSLLTDRFDNCEAAEAYARLLNRLSTAFGSHEAPAAEAMCSKK
jgi:hypothetical protein